MQGNMRRQRCNTWAWWMELRADTFKSIRFKHVSLLMLYVVSVCAGGSQYHGASGLMKVTNPEYDNTLHEQFFKAAAAAGLVQNDDFNNWSRPQVGAGEREGLEKWDGKAVCGFSNS